MRSISSQNSKKNMKDDCHTVWDRELRVLKVILDSFVATWPTCTFAWNLLQFCRHIKKYLASKMAESVHLLNQTVTTGGRKYITEHKWILNDWDLLYGSTYMDGIRSGEFRLNGTDSTYQLFLHPMNDDNSYLLIEFSDTGHSPSRGEVFLPE